MDMIMSNISDVEEQIYQKIFRLGQLYYEQHKDNAAGDPAYGEIVDIINKLSRNRIGFYKNKLRLEGQMMCENCGAIIPYGSVFCGHCGKRADEKEEGAAVSFLPNTNRCAKCGAELESGSLFCTVCGAKVQ